MKKFYLFSIVLLVVGGIFGNILRYSGRMPDRLADFSVIPENHGGYFGYQIPLAEFTKEILKADLAELREYQGPGISGLELFTAYFSSQKYGSQIHSPKHCLPGGGWRIDHIEPYRLDLPDGRTKAINLMIISSGEARVITLYWYETRSGVIRGEYALKLDLIKNALLFRPTDAAIIRMTIEPSGRDISEAVREGADFLRVFHPFLMESLPF